MWICVVIHCTSIWRGQHHQKMLSMQVDARILEYIVHNDVDNAVKTSLEGD